MPEREDQHAGVNTWIFVAIATGKLGSPGPTHVADVIENADYYAHDIPNVDNLQHAVRDLRRANLITVAADGFGLTPSGRVLWNRIRQAWPRTSTGKSGQRSGLEIAQDVAGDIACTAPDPGDWSITQAQWEDAFAAYSPQFALELARRRRGGS